MITYEIAHIRVQGQDMIIVPMNGQWAQTATEADRQSTESYIQACAADAGLAGIVCMAWQFGTGFYFRAPPTWHPFFQGLDMPTVIYNLNKTLRCGSSGQVYYVPPRFESATPNPQTEEKKAKDEARTPEDDNAGSSQSTKPA